MVAIQFSYLTRFDMSGVCVYCNQVLRAAASPCDRLSRSRTTISYSDSQEIIDGVTFRLDVPTSSLRNLLGLPGSQHFSSHMPRLKTPPTLHIFTKIDASLGLRAYSNSHQSEIHNFRGDIHLQDRDNPCGLCDSLCTLRLSCSRWTSPALRQRRNTRYW